MCSKSSQSVVFKKVVQGWNCAESATGSRLDGAHRLSAKAQWVSNSGFKSLTLGVEGEGTSL